MRKQLCALLLLLSFAHLADAQTRNARERAGLRGPVKSVRLETSKIHEQDGEPVESRRALESVTRFDETGNEMEEAIYADGVLNHKIISGYDAQGDFISTRYNSEGVVVARSIVKYDGAGRETEFSAYNTNGDLTRRVTYVRDDLGKLIEEIAFDRFHPSRSHRTAHFYDKAGKRTLSKLYDADGVLKQENAHARGETNVVQHNKDGSTTHWGTKLSDLTIEYDSQGNWTKRALRRNFIESGQTKEFVEVTYRKITYH